MTPSASPNPENFCFLAVQPQARYLTKKLYGSSKADVKDLFEPSKIIVVSSAYWLILISFPRKVIPFISLFSRILLANIRGKGANLPDSSFRGKVTARPSVVKDAAFSATISQFNPIY